MEFLVLISVLLSIGFVVFSISWMIQILRLSREKRVIQSMHLKAFLEYCKKQGCEIDIANIQREVEKNA